jgi:23S rRNA pseudouridine1911/1915/1917 synthase
VVQEIRVPAGAATERLDKLLPKLLPGTSRTTIQRWIEEQRVLVDGRVRRGKELVEAGALISVDPAPPPASTALPDPSIAIDCVYEDEHLLVVNKPAGLVVHPARGHWQGTLVNGLLGRGTFARAPVDPGDTLGSLRPGIVHRLDKDTSGLMVIAKNEPAREGLKSQLARHEVLRRYVALTVGMPEAARIESLHARNPHNRLKFTSLTGSGKRAITRLAIEEVFSASGAALVRCELETGRTHQIRVHLAERSKTPILGDAVYGGAKPRQPLLRQLAAELGHQALHAQMLRFTHPVSGQALALEAPPPPDFAHALACLRTAENVRPRT